MSISVKSRAGYQYVVTACLTNSSFHGQHDI